MSKLIKLSPTKAYQLEAIDMEGNKCVSIRQMYAKKSEPDNWLPGRSGLSLPWEYAMEILKSAAEVRKDPHVKFKKIVNKE